MTRVPVKFVILTLVFTLMGGTAAFAAMGGDIPFVSDTENDGASVRSDAYPDNHGKSVSEVAGDKEAIGTWTNPAGKLIENHGQAVREAAHNKEWGDKDSASDNASQDEGDNPSGGGEEIGSGSTVQPANNAGGNGNGNPGGRSR